MVDSKNNRLFAIAAIVLLVSLVGNGVFMNNRSAVIKEKDKAVLKMDSLLSATLLIEKELDGTRARLAASDGKNAELSKSITELNNKLSDNRRQIEQLLKENSGVNSLRKKLKEAQRNSAYSEKLVNDYLREKDVMEAEINTLKQSNARLGLENVELKKKLELAKGLAAFDMVVSGQRVSGRSSKPTLIAKKTNRISASFSLAENPLSDPGLKNVYLVVYDPSGNIIQVQPEKFTNRTNQNETGYSALKPVDYKNSEIRLNVAVDVKQKLVKGRYRAEVYTDGMLSGKKEFILK